MNINLSTVFNSLGFGNVGLNVALALEKLGHQVAFWNVGTSIEASPENHEQIKRMIARTNCYDKNAPSLRIWHQFSLAQHVGKKLHCAMPIFELTKFLPNEINHLKNQDLLIVNSRWAKEILENNGIDKNLVVVAPLGVDTSIFKPTGVLRQQEANPTVFLNVGKWEYRKGHDVLVEAFNKAFEQDDNVQLIMNCVNPCLRTSEEMQKYNQEWISLYKKSKLGEKIDVAVQRLPEQKDVASLMEIADCGVFPSRAEGWNLEATEMLAMGKHLIITNYSAHTQYANYENSLLIEIDKWEDAHDGIWFHANNPDWNGNPGQWAELGESQVDQMVAHMRSIHKRKQEGSLRKNCQGIETANKLSWENTAKKIIQGISSGN